MPHILAAFDFRLFSPFALTRPVPIVPFLAPNHFAHTTALACVPGRRHYDTRYMRDPSGCTRCDPFPSIHWLIGSLPVSAPWRLTERSWPCLTHFRFRSNLTNSYRDQRQHHPVLPLLGVLHAQLHPGPGKEISTLSLVRSQQTIAHCCLYKDNNSSRAVRSKVFKVGKGTARNKVTNQV